MARDRPTVPPLRLCIRPVAPHSFPYLTDCSSRCNSASQMSLTSTGPPPKPALSLHDDGRVQPTYRACLTQMGLRY